MKRKKIKEARPILMTLLWLQWIKTLGSEPPGQRGSMYLMTGIQLTHEYFTRISLVEMKNVIRS